jgi:predicted RNA-binding protein YlqC (UPF0109 family)
MSNPLVNEATGPHPGDAEVRELLRTLVTALVDDSDQVQVISVDIDDGVAFEVRSAKEDLGKLIGKNGRTARAIRVILSAVAAKRSRRYSLDIAQHGSYAQR